MPIVFDSPHSGRFYPEDFRTKVPLALLRQGEDAYVDELIADAVGSGVTVLLANYPRCYIDANREPDDLDAELLSEPWPTPLRPSRKTRMGVGLIRRHVVPGVEVHADKLSVADVQHRLDKVYWPYHRALREALDRVRRQFGFVWHIDWHSMKSVGNAMTPDGIGKRRPDFVVSDREGISAEPVLTSLAAEFLSGLGHRVSINDPYKGAAILRRYGAPSDGAHSLQIEINRRLYLDEETVTRSRDFEALRGKIAAFTAHLVEAARAKLHRG
ncbi:MAG TPA: N-formylglutamate amidohydrolase [Alphaproteobacteria bacterium]|nr:N-formylglutamate amidohydrolase [Alphaproteobacteria bacterium]